MIALPRPAMMTARSAHASTRPVHVNFVIDRLSRAGTETQLLALLAGLDRTKVCPSLTLLDGTDAESQALLPHDCPVRCLGIRSLRSLGTLTKLAALVRFWREQRTDIVQTYFLDSTYVAVPLAKLCGIRRVVRVRNNTGYWLNRPHRLLGKIMGRCASTTLTNSHDGATALRHAEQLPRSRVHVLENGVDLDRFAMVQPPFQTSSIRIGAVANLRPVKNMDGLLRSATALHARFPHVTWAIAGDGEQRASLQAQIDAAGLRACCTLLGSTRDVPSFLASVDIAVLPSHAESMSNALLEYMAAGRTIVATNVGANATLIRHEREGLIVPPHDDAALTQSIGRLLENPTWGRTLADAARQRAAAEYSRATMLQRFEHFYRQLLHS